jgi:uncharacterized Zn finger protein
VSDIVGAKAISLVTNGGITENTYARIFEARGSTGATYVVVLGAGESGTSCTCPAGREGRRCYHVAAARLLVAKEVER